MSSDDITKLIALGIPIVMIILSAVGRIWCYISDKRIENEVAKLESNRTLLNESIQEAIKESSVTTEEAAEEFDKFKEVAMNPTLTINEKRKAIGLDEIKEQLENSRYGIVTLDPDTTIETVNPPKEYCQCDHCGTFYNEFVSNCKNCGAQIKMPSELYKRDYIIKVNGRHHNVFDI